MSNLGLYQTFTTVAKKVGGPGKLIGLIFGSGVVVGSASTIGVGKLIKKISNKKEINKTYIVKREGTSNEGIKLHVGEKYNVLSEDEDIVLIEIVGRDDNPFYVSRSFLESISDFKVYKKMMIKTK